MIVPYPDRCRIIPTLCCAIFFLFSFGSAFRRKEVKKVGGRWTFSLLGTNPAQKADAPEPSRREADQYFHVWAFARDHSMPSTATKRRPSQQLVRISPHRADYSASSRDREREKKEEEMLPCISSFVLDPTAKLKKRKKKKRNERMEGTRVVAALSARSRDSASLIASIMFYSEPFNRLIRK